MLRSRVAAVLALAASVAVAAPASAAEPFHSWHPAKRAHHGHGVPTFFHVNPAFGTVGAPGLGDPFFPLAGNGGYDVRHYSLQLAYDPGTTVLEGTATITATAKQNLTRFDLDLRGFTIGSLKVDGRGASFGRDGQELQITPASALKAGRQFTVTVRYSGTPQVVTDPDGSIEGWVPTSDGAYVVGEPQGSPAWFPCNDNPRDKATYDIAMTVPAGLTAVSNGTLVGQSTRNGQTTFAWRESLPMATYLATTTLGHFDVTKGKIAGIPSYVAVDPSQAAGAAPALAQLPEIVKFLSSIYGPYPFDTVGAIVDDAPDVGYSLESQTKPNFDSAPDDFLLAHEISHQWVGDSVTLGFWPDIWLHEGFATYNEWLWADHTGQFTPQGAFDFYYSLPDTDPLWSPPPATPGDPANLFGNPVYVRGAMTLQVLRNTVGDSAFFRILRRWATQYRYGNVTTPQFIALAQQESHMNLGALFQRWLYEDGKPAI
jgi:aminopeptidase N